MSTRQAANIAKLSCGKLELNLYSWRIPVIILGWPGVIRVWDRLDMCGLRWLDGGGKYQLVLAQASCKMFKTSILDQREA